MALPRRQHSAVIALHQQNHSLGSIAQQLNLSRSTVQNIVRKFKQGGGSGARQKTQPPKVRTKDQIRKIARKIAANPVRSITDLAKDAGCNRKTMQKLVRLNLGMKSLKQRRTFVLSDAAKTKRLDRSKKLRTRLRRHGTDSCIWTDEKWFTGNQQVGRILAQSTAAANPAFLNVQQAQHPVKCMAWVGVCEGGKTSIHIVPQGTTVDSLYYQQSILTPALKEIKAKLFPGGQHFLFQQDGAPPHTANSTQAFLTGQGVDFIKKDAWPPYSPDLNPVDYCVWGVMQAKVNRKSYKTVAALEAAVRKAWRELDQDVVKAACEGIMGRLDKVIANQGGHIQ